MNDKQKKDLEAIIKETQEATRYIWQDRPQCVIDCMANIREKVRNIFADEPVTTLKNYI